MSTKNFGIVLGKLERDVMEIVWQSDNTVSGRGVTEKLQKDRMVAYTTIMTIMGRLVAKGLLKRKSQGNAYVYQAVYTKDKFLTKVSRQLITNFVDSFGELAVAHFIQEVEHIKPESREKLLKILKGLEKK